MGRFKAVIHFHHPECFQEDKSYPPFPTLSRPKTQDYLAATKNPKGQKPDDIELVAEARIATKDME